MEPMSVVSFRVSPVKEAHIGLFRSSLDCSEKSCHTFGHGRCGSPVSDTSLDKPAETTSAGVAWMFQSEPVDSTPLSPATSNPKMVGGQIPGVNDPQDSSQGHGLEAAGPRGPRSGMALLWGSQPRAPATGSGVCQYKRTPQNWSLHLNQGENGTLQQKHISQ